MDALRNRLERIEGLVESCPRGSSLIFGREVKDKCSQIKRFECQQKKNISL